MRLLIFTLIILALPWKVGAYSVIEKQCPKCEGLCIPHTYVERSGPITEVPIIGMCQVTLRTFQFTPKIPARVRWVLDFDKMKYIDSLYRASREPEDTVPMGVTPVMIKTKECCILVTVQDSTGQIIGWQRTNLDGWTTWFLGEGSYIFTIESKKGN